LGDRKKDLRGGKNASQEENGGLGRLKHGPKVGLPGQNKKEDRE